MSTRGAINTSWVLSEMNCLTAVKYIIHRLGVVPPEFAWRLRHVVVVRTRLDAAWRIAIRSIRFLARAPLVRR